MRSGREGKAEQGGSPRPCAASVSALGSAAGCANPGASRGNDVTRCEGCVTCGCGTWCRTHMSADAVARLRQHGDPGLVCGGKRRSKAWVVGMLDVGRGGMGLDWTGGVRIRGYSLTQSSQGLFSIFTLCAYVASSTQGEDLFFQD